MPRTSRWRLEDSGRPSPGSVTSNTDSSDWRKPKRDFQYFLGFVGNNPKNNATNAICHNELLRLINSNLNDKLGDKMPGDKTVQENIIIINEHFESIKHNRLRHLEFVSMKKEKQQSRRVYSTSS